MEFTETPKYNAPPEITAMQQHLGGQIGTVRFSNMEMKNVLRVSDNIYAAPGPVNKTWDTAAALDGSSIHSIEKPADAMLFQARYKESTQSAPPEAKSKGG